MLTIQKKGLVCFMGFAVLSIFNMNNSFAFENANKSQIKENSKIIFEEFYSNSSFLFYK